MKTKNKSKRSKGIIGITLAAIMIASIFAMVAPTTVANGNPPAPPTPPWGGNYSSIKIYGDVQGQGNAPEFYDNWAKVFDPTVIPKDSITCNPAIMSEYFNTTYVDIQVNGDNAWEKVFLRGWYEPCGRYNGSRKNHTYPTINLEYTYMLLNKTGWPTSGKGFPMDYTDFYFPTKKKTDQSGLGIDELVRLANVTSVSISSHNKTTNGTIRLELLQGGSTQITLTQGQEVQFLDHRLQYVGETAADEGVVKVWYAGNTVDDTPKGFIRLPIDTPYYFDRHNNMATTASHPDRTWYAIYRDDHMFTIGKEFSTNDTFYVNGVRYDVTAIEVLNTKDEEGKADSFKFITIRTKLPKGNDDVQDESVVSTQRIDEVTQAEIIPVLPPFNEKYHMVDDIDIPLWKTAPAERYWTMQNGTWGNATDVNKLNTNLGVIIPPYDQGWIAYDVGERVIPDEVDPLNMTYIAEDVEKRYSTNLLEKLNETLGGLENVSDIGFDDQWGTNASLNRNESVKEDWTKFDVQTLPDQYTEFVLPPRPDYYNISGRNWPVNLSGDYLITTSLIAPQATGDLYDHKEGTITGYPTEHRVAFSYDPRDGEDDIDIYVNYNTANDVNTVRIYGNETSNPYDIYEHWEQPFNPTVIRKDSITFDAAILRFSPEYSMTAQNENCDMKTYLRVWYDNLSSRLEHPEPAVVTETTYMLIDSQNKKPFHGEANDTYFAFPIVSNLTDDRAKGLQFFENPDIPELNTSVVNLVRLVNVSSRVEMGNYSKTTNGTIRIEKEYILSIGESVQFLDHVLKYISETGNEVEISYAGERDFGDRGLGKNHPLVANNSFFDTKNNLPSSYPVHPHETWYARENGRLGSQIMVTVGKELQQGDVFYVDGVRYEIPAIEVLDWNGNGTNGPEKFKFITLRTQFPKGEGYKRDNDVLSIDIYKLPSCNATPVLPPFNMNHEIVDDTDVVLWQPLKLLHKWPYGDVDSGRPGAEYFPCADRYLTMQYPPYAWLKYFRAVPIDTDSDMSTLMPTDWQLWENYPGPFYPGDDLPSGWQCCKCGIPMGVPSNYTVFDKEHWIANDVDERIIDAGPLNFCWKSEGVEPRYSTNLLEILYEGDIGETTMYENWTKYDIRTMPENYTEFKLPPIPSLNPEVYVGGEYQQYFRPDKSDYPGSYLITTSFLAPNALGDLNLNQTYSSDGTAANRSRFAFTYNASDGTGIYMNENVTMPIAPVGERFDISLYDGDNYISLPVMPGNTDPAAIFGPEVVVLEYNPTGMGNWTSTSAVAGGTGYYVLAPKPKTVTIWGTGVALTWADITLQTGWNLIGPGNTSIVVPSDVLIMTYVKGVPAGFVPHPPGQKLEPGKGYWAYKPT